MPGPRVYGGGRGGGGAAGGVRLRDMSRPYPAAKGGRAASVRPPLIRRCGATFPQEGKA